MLPPHWKTLQPLLDEALDASPADRAALLNKWRTDFPHLADELQRLLQSHEQAESESFLQGEPSTGAGLFATPLAGQRLGAYTLQEPIGEGGMGSVWLARRDDGRFEGVVAVKLLSLSMQGEVRAERFRREGHILARLAHPHIARMLDAGVSPAGQPYLVLEHVQGRHVDVHCNEERLGLEARIRLFLTLLDAVQHAHGHLVVHRDIKPSNVMVDEDGQLKLLDFGIAKLMTADGNTTSPAEAPLTQQAGTLLSPGYAAPEQVQSGTVSTATDVYALGVLLYLLLSDRHPTTRPGSSAAQALHDTLQRDAPLMSRAAQGDEEAAAARGLRTAAFKRALEGDLDNIAAKALRREPTERYATAAAFADDLRRHLAHQPVLARKPGASYLLGRFVQRHRLPVAATLAGTVLLAGSGWQAWQQKQAARLSQTQAQTVDGLLQSLFRGMSPDVAASRSFSAKELLDRGQAFLDSRSDVDPATRRAARLRMAELYRDVGAYPESAAAFKAEAAEAKKAGDPAAEALALWQWSNVTLKTLDVGAATKAVELFSQVVDGNPKRSPGMVARVALLQGELALLRHQTQEAEKALSMAESLLDPATDIELLARVAMSRSAASKSMGNASAARAHLDHASELQQKRGDDAVVDRLAVSLRIGSLENWAGRHDEASRALRPAYADLRARLGAAHPLAVGAICELAYAELRQGQFAEARKSLVQVREGATSSDAWRKDYADLIEATAQLYEGKADKAEPELLRLLKAMERDEGGISPATEPMRRLHAEALLRLNRLADAEAALLQVERNQMGFAHPDPFSIASTRVLLGIVWARQGSLDAARHTWRQSADVMAKEVGPQHITALLAASYTALAEQGNTGNSAERRALADRLESRALWLAGVPPLASMLRASDRPTNWGHLPVAQ